MTRLTSLAAFLLIVILHSDVHGQQWARKMFSVTSHDFGTLARGSKAEFEFEIQNVYEEDVHIAAVRSSCGCTDPRIKTRTLKTWEKGAIVAAFNTRSFLGQRSATITVTIDKPFYAEVQLHVQGYIRSDVVFKPGVVNLGDVDEGATAEQSVEVVYAGRSSWRIVDVQSANPHFEVELGNAQAGSGRVTYDMKIRLLGDTPPGYLQDELAIITNDGRLKRIPLAIQGRVVSSLSVNPASVFFGVVSPGETVTKKILVRSKTPFRVTAVRCADECFAFATDDESKPLHFIPVTFTAGTEPGQINKEVAIETDLPSGGTTRLIVTATVK